MKVSQWIMSENLKNNEISVKALMPGRVLLKSPKLKRRIPEKSLSKGNTKLASSSAKKSNNNKLYKEFLIYTQLKEEVAEFYKYPGLWLEAPHQMLGGQTPLQLALSSTSGKEVVLNLIQMIKTGMFT